MNAFQFSLRVPDFIMYDFFAEEGTRRFAVSLRARLSSTASRTGLSTSCASVAFIYAPYGSL
ncbi:hypothetical protein CH371_01825 [Leptospira wolffii]|uniref:Uncharacterized protein n=1 Tax=Leptospira wolffii TaxID=409998 RepID=A0A2M9ZEJ2_9LEPT|nr:hypothetical protein CH371_01825 [Leptospira wolffii]